MRTLPPPHLRLRLQRPSHSANSWAALDYHEKEPTSSQHQPHKLHYLPGLQDADAASGIISLKNSSTENNATKLLGGLLSIKQEWVGPSPPPHHPQLEAAEVSLGEKQRPGKEPTTAFMPSAPGRLLHLLLDADG